MVKNAIILLNYYFKDKILNKNYCIIINNFYFAYFLDG